MESPEGHGLAEEGNPAEGRAGTGLGPQRSLRAAFSRPVRRDLPWSAPDAQDRLGFLILRAARVQTRASGNVISKGFRMGPGCRPAPWTLPHPLLLAPELCDVQGSVQRPRK